MSSHNPPDMLGDVNDEEMYDVGGQLSVNTSENEHEGEEAFDSDDQHYYFDYYSGYRADHAELDELKREELTPSPDAETAKNLPVITPYNQLSDREKVERSRAAARKANAELSKHRRHTDALQHQVEVNGNAAQLHIDKARGLKRENIKLASDNTALQNANAALQVANDVQAKEILALQRELAKLDVKTEVKSKKTATSMTLPLLPGRPERVRNPALAIAEASSMDIDTHRIVRCNTCRTNDLMCDNKHPCDNCNTPAECVRSSCRDFYKPAAECGCDRAYTEDLVGGKRGGAAK